MRSLVFAVVVGAFFIFSLPTTGVQDLDDLFAEPDTTVESDNGATENGDATDSTETISGGHQPTADEVCATSGEPGDAGNDSDAETASEAAVDIAALTTSPTTVGGSFSGTGGIGLGFLEWPESDAAGDQSLRDLLEYSILYSSTASVTVDSRPAPYLRFHTKVSTSLSSSSLIYTAPTISELFIDYTLAERYFFRVGRYGMTWGNGRLFDNPADLVDRVEDGAAVRISFPLWPGGSFSGLVYSRSAWDPETNGYRAFAWAGQVDTTAGPVTGELSGHYKDGEPVGTALGITVGKGEFTVAAEGVWNIDPDDPGGNGDSWLALGNFFWENDSRSWSLTGEYQYDHNATDENGGRHLVGFALAAPSLKTGGTGRTGSWRPGLRWKHAIEDTSGEIVLGTKGAVAPRLDLSVGVPVIYGTPGTYFRDALATTSGLESESEELELLIPVDNVVMVLLAVSLSMSF